MIGEIDIQLIKLPHFQGELPKRATDGSAGVDLAFMPEGGEPLQLYPGQTEVVGTGLRVYIADPMFVGLVFPRSGMGIRGLVLANSTGIIDSDYQGELKLALWNRLPAGPGNQALTIYPGDRVAQLLIVPVIQARWQSVDEFVENRARLGRVWA